MTSVRVFDTTTLASVKRVDGSGEVRTITLNTPKGDVRVTAPWNLWGFYELFVGKTFHEDAHYLIRGTVCSSASDAADAIVSCGGLVCHLPLAICPTDMSFDDVVYISLVRK